MPPINMNDFFNSVVYVVPNYSKDAPNANVLEIRTEPCTLEGNSFSQDAFDEKMNLLAELIERSRANPSIDYEDEFRAIMSINTATRRKITFVP